MTIVVGLDRRGEMTTTLPNGNVEGLKVMRKVSLVIKGEMKKSHPSKNVEGQVVLIVMGERKTLLEKEKLRSGLGTESGK